MELSNYLIPSKRSKNLIENSLLARTPEKDAFVDHPISNTRCTFGRPYSAPPVNRQQIRQHLRLARAVRVAAEHS